MTNNTKQQPVHRVQFGNVKVAIWANTNAEGKTFHNFGLTRSYKDNNDQWQEQTISLNLGEVAKASFALEKAYKDYYTLPQFRKNAGEVTESEVATTEATTQPEGEY